MEEFERVKAGKTPFSESWSIHSPRLDGEVSGGGTRNRRAVDV